MTLRDARHVVITGGAGAIGGALATALRARAPQATLTLADVDAPAAERVAKTLGANAHVVTWDLCLPDTLPDAVASLEGERGPIDVLVNCAGIMEIRSLTATAWSLAERLLAIDLLSPLRLMSLLAPTMAARRHGHIINVSSMAGITPLRGCAYYGAAKAGLAIASEVARLELLPRGVTVTTVYPGPVRSALEARARAQAPNTLIARLLPTGDAVELAGRIAAAADRGDSRVVYPLFYDLASRVPRIASRVTRALSPVPFDR